jgi:hypothetical protein
VSVKWPDLHTLELLPATRLIAGKRYSLRFDGRRFRDYSGHTLSDTTTDLSFSIYAPDSMGTVTGELLTKVNAQYIIRVLRLKNHAEVASTVTAGSGSFRIELLPVGKYLLGVARDVNRDSLVTNGRMWPFEFSEPFIISTDTIAIRARWEYDTRIIWHDNP